MRVFVYLGETCDVCLNKDVRGQIYEKQRKCVFSPHADKILIFQRFELKSRI